LLTKLGKAFFYHTKKRKAWEEEMEITTQSLHEEGMGDISPFKRFQKRLVFFTTVLCSKGRVPDRQGMVHRTTRGSGRVIGV
jgi:hypothetical protein